MAVLDGMDLGNGPSAVPGLARLRQSSHIVEILREPKARKGAATVSQAGGGTHTSVPEIDSPSRLFTVKERRIPPDGKQSASRLLSP